MNKPSFDSRQFWMFFVWMFCLVLVQISSTNSFNSVNNQVKQNGKIASTCSKCQKRHNSNSSGSTRYALVEVRLFQLLLHLCQISQVSSDEMVVSGVEVKLTQLNFTV